MPRHQGHSPKWVLTKKRTHLLEEVLQTTSAILSLLALLGGGFLLYRFYSKGFESFAAPERHVLVGLFGLLMILPAHFLAFFYLRRQGKKADQVSHSNEPQPVYDWDGFHKVLRREIRRGGRYHLPMTLCFLSVDDIEMIMHERGSGYGEKLLERFSELMIGIVRSSDYFAQLEENEFCILLCHTDVPNAEKFLFRALLQSQERLETSFSAGLTAYRTGENPGELLKRAQQALAGAQQEGHKKIHCAIGKDDSQVIRSF